MNSRNYSPAMDDISRYLSDEMDAVEKLLFEHRLEEQPILKREFNEVKAAWDALENLSGGSVDEVDTDTAWNNLSLKLQEEPLVRSLHHKNISLSLLKWAAAVFILVGLGWMYNYFAVSPDDTSLLVFENKDEQHVSARALRDGSLVYLADNSSIQYPEIFAEDERMIMMEGEAFFEVAHDTQKPFRIKAGNANVEVLGTSFNIKSNGEDSFELFVETGRVRVTMANGNQEKIMGPGQLISIRDDNFQVEYPETYNTMWRKNVIQFRDEKLEDIFFILGKTYGYNFIIEDEALKARLMTLTVYKSSLQIISESIALSLSADYELKNDSVAVFRSGQ